MRGTFDEEIKGAIAAKGGSGTLNAAKKPFGKKKNGSLFKGKPDQSAPLVGPEGESITKMSKPAVTKKQESGLKAAGGFAKNGPAELNKGR